MTLFGPLLIALFSTYIPPGSNIGEMTFDSAAGTDTFRTAGAWQMVYIASAWATGEVQNWTYADGGAGTIASAADGGGGTVTFTTGAAHGLSAGEIVSVTGTTNYNDVYSVVSTPAADEFKVTAVWVSNQSGYWHKSATLTAKTGVAGKYTISYSMSMSSNTASQTVGVAIFQNADVPTNSKCTSLETTSPTINEYVVLAASCSLTIADGDILSFGIQNILAAGATFQPKHINVVVGGR